MKRLLDRFSVEVKNIWRAFNWEEVKKALEELVEKELPMEEEKREIYRARFKNLLRKGKPYQANWGAGIFGYYWLGYRQRFFAGLYLFLLMSLFQLLEVKVFLANVAFFQSHASLGLFWILLILLTTLAPFLYCFLFADAYLALTMSNGLSAHRSFKHALALFVAIFLLSELFSLLLPV